jgi:ribosomal protein S18 acetylase RimI-like enzyme
MIDSIRFRLCRPDDSPQILALWKAADATPSVTDTREDVRRTIECNEAVFLVATDVSGRIIGSVIGGWDGWRGNIYRLAVAPDARRLGVACALVNEVCARLVRDKGARRITAMVEQAHEDAAGFWNSMSREGFNLDPRLVRYVKTAE